MAHFLVVVTSFPSVIYTVLLGVVLAYWAFVVAGAVGLDLLGDGDLGGDGVDGGLDHGDVGDLGDGADAHGHGHAHGHGEGAFSGMLAALRLRAVPVTVALSGIILFSWLFCVLAMQALTTALPPGAALVVAKVLALVLSPVVALPFASLAVRPLAGLFAPPLGATASHELIGKLCVVRTSRVTGRFGEATVKDGGAGLVVRVRVEHEERLGRGDQAVIVGYDAVTEQYTVAPLDDMLPERDADRRGA